MSDSDDDLFGIRRRHKAWQARLGAGIGGDCGEGESDTADDEDDASGDMDMQVTDKAATFLATDRPAPCCVLTILWCLSMWHGAAGHSMVSPRPEAVAPTGAVAHRIVVCWFSSTQRQPHVQLPPLLLLLLCCCTAMLLCLSLTLHPDIALPPQRPHCLVPTALPAAGCAGRAWCGRCHNSCSASCVVVCRGRCCRRRLRTLVAHRHPAAVAGSSHVKPL